TDFLWPLTQAQLAAARFPVGDLTKDEVRTQARRLGLATADKPESQDLCFVPDDDYRGFLRRRVPDVFRPGAIVDRCGNTLGAHGGIAGFTVGQKRGLGLATGRPLYVIDLDPEHDTIRVGEAADLERDRLVATSVNFIACAPPRAPLRVAAKIRHSHQPAAATVRAPAGTPAAEGGHESGGLISLDKSLIIQFVNFIILLLILQRLLYKPFLAKMAERTQAIQKSLDEAQAARAQAARQQEENETRLRAAHAEA